MKYVDEFRDPEAAHGLARAIKAMVTRPWTIMEVCGGQTHSIVKYGLEQLLPAQVELLHGPGCPVCVTPSYKIDAAIAVAARPEVILCSFGDMLRVPGSKEDLLTAKSRGADVRVVYSPLDALELARKHGDRQVVFFGVGFETTAPANAMAIFQAEQEGLGNFSVLLSHVLVPPAMTAILSGGSSRIDGFLAAGHVCTIMGTWQYEPIASAYKVPIVVTGFEPLDVLQGVYLCVKQLEEGRYEVENQYSRVVQAAGNQVARSLLAEVFEIQEQNWRGMGSIPESGLGLKTRYHRFDAERRFELNCTGSDDTRCQAGRVLTGQMKPTSCPEFGRGCIPSAPLGALMVSSEGACAAYFNYKREASHV